MLCCLTLRQRSEFKLNSSACIFYANCGDCKKRNAWNQFRPRLYRLLFFYDVKGYAGFENSNLFNLHSKQCFCFQLYRWSKEGNSLVKASKNIGHPYRYII